MKCIYTYANTSETFKGCVTTKDIVHEACVQHHMKSFGPKMVLEFVTLHLPSLLIIILVIGPVGTRQRRT